MSKEGPPALAGDAYRRSAPRTPPPRRYRCACLGKLKTGWTCHKGPNASQSTNSGWVGVVIGLFPNRADVVRPPFSGMIVSHSLSRPGG